MSENGQGNDFFQVKEFYFESGKIDILKKREVLTSYKTELEDHTGEYWPEVVAVQTERSEVHTKTTEG